jgi:hypothetical protein
MSDLNSPKHGKNRNNASEQVCGQFDVGRDMLAKELLHNINTTPIGRLLKQIAEMPEIRYEKVSDVRNQLKRGEYNLNERLELALDRVLEELIM